MNMKESRQNWFGFKQSVVGVFENRRELERCRRRFEKSHINPLSDLLFLVEAANGRHPFFSDGVHFFSDSLSGPR
jgi:hypothetical protein